jgi:acetoin utilization deacetylase AcuC-like enzyme
MGLDVAQGGVVGPVSHEGTATARPSDVWRALRRQWRWLCHAVRPPAVKFIYDPAYERNFVGVALDPLRADRILAFLVNERLAQREEISRPQQVALKNVLLVHAPEYLDALQDPATLTSILGVPVGEGELEDVLSLQRLMVGGTIHATRWATTSGCAAVNLGGGFHHAGRARGAGFCVFNDIAIAIARLRARGFVESVLVVDLDLHDGNGTREIFAADPSVHTFSIHNRDWGETAAVASTSIALGENVGDELYLSTLLKALPGVFDAHRPGLVIYLAGSDVAADDRLGDWGITAEGILARDRFVVELTRRAQSRLVVVLGGGYGESAWRYPARFLAWLAGGAAVEPPESAELALLRFRQLKAILDPAHLTGSGAANGWQLTEEDLVGILPGVPRHTRFLEYFSTVGVELLLERFGILQQLRARGFKNPLVHLELEHPLGQTMKIFGDADRRELLVELRVHRSSRTVPGCEVLEVEWLLLQNPREAFSPAHPLLPGQQHPGLGLLPEFFGWLMGICEMLSLDGVAFRASHYHIAALARRHARFLQPRHEALYRAIEKLCQGLSVGEVSRAIAEGRILASPGGPALTWEGWPMVLPATPRLREKLEGAGYVQEVAAVTDVALRLAPPTLDRSGPVPR